MSAPYLSVVVPAYDEASHIEPNIRRLLACLEAGSRSFEIIVVDDGSRDGTGEAARGIDDPRVRVHALSENQGKGRALEHGVHEARGEVLVLLDADLEIPPEEIGPLVDRLEAESADLVLGTKYGAQRAGAWPLYRRVLSRLYQAVTSLLFRLPLRDTQTGLKVIRTAVARRLVPHLTCRRFAWDLEFVLLALETGHRFATVPVALAPTERASRVGWAGALLAGIDTVRIFLRHRCLGRYGAARTATAVPRPTRILISGDDLGLSPGVNAGLVAGAARGGLRSVSVLAQAPHAEDGIAALAAAAPGADLGLHLDLLRGRSLLAGLASSLRPSHAPGPRLSAQLAALGSVRLVISHVDAHRHAWCLPWSRRAAVRAVRRERIPAVRALRPLGPVFGAGLVEGAKRLVLLGLASLSAGVARRQGLAVPDGFVDVATARAWLDAGRLPPWTRGRTIEVIAHPAEGPADVPAGETGTLDRASDARAILDPPLAGALEGIGARVIGFDELAKEAAS